MLEVLSEEVHFDDFFFFFLSMRGGRTYHFKPVIVGFPGMPMMAQH